MKKVKQSREPQAAGISVPGWADFEGRGGGYAIILGGGLPSNGKEAIVAAVDAGQGAGIVPPATPAKVTDSKNVLLLFI